MFLLKKYLTLSRKKPMGNITSSVGDGGVNNRSDVSTVQRLLNRFPQLGDTPLKVDGLCGRGTISRIRAFQSQVLKSSRPDGRVDPGGRTLAALNAGGEKPRRLSVSDEGLELLKAIEGKRLKPYDDQTGRDISHWVEGATIGYGHLISRDEWDRYKNGIGDQEAEALFRTDLEPFQEAIRTKVQADLTQNEFDALLIFVFNIGIRAFSQSSVLKLINNPQAHTSYASLEDAWKAWNKSQGQVMQGLINRRNAEWNVYSKNRYEVWW